MLRTLPFVSLVLASLLALPALAAPPEGKGHGKGKPSHEHASPSGVENFTTC